MTATAAPRPQKTTVAGRTPPFTAHPAVVPLNALRSAVQALAGALPAGDAATAAKTAPILSYLLVRCFSDTVELVGSDLDTVAGARIGRDEVAAPTSDGAPLWSMLVPGRLLHDLLGRIAPDALGKEPAILQPIAPEVLRLVTRDGRADLAGADPVLYPMASPFEEPPAAGAPFRVQAGQLATLIEQTVAAAAPDKTADHPLMANLRLWAPEWSDGSEGGERGNGLFLEGSDGYRIAHSGYARLLSAHHDPRLADGVLVPAKTLRLLRGLLRRTGGDAALVDLQLLPPPGDDPTDADPAPKPANLLTVALPAGLEGVTALVLRSRLSQGKYPDWSNFLCRSVDVQADVDAGALLYHVRQAALFAPRAMGAQSVDHAPLSLTLDAAAPPAVALRLASKSAEGEHRAWLAAAVTAKGLVAGPVTVGLSTGFLQAVLGTAPGKRVRIGLETGLLPVHVEQADRNPEGDPTDYHAVLMPMGGPNVAPDPGPPPEAAAPGQGESPSAADLV